MLIASTLRHYSHAIRVKSAKKLGSFPLSLVADWCSGVASAGLNACFIEPIKLHLIFLVQVNVMIAASFDIDSSFEYVYMSVNKLLYVT
jgi:hypothetical protein